MDIVEEIESEIYGATRVFKIPSALWEKGLWEKGGQRKDEAVLPYIHLAVDVDVGQPKSRRESVGT
jgi:hypothetical protein